MSDGDAGWRRHVSTWRIRGGIEGGVVAAILFASAAGRCACAEDAGAIPTLHVTDLFRPPNDPDDHWDLTTQYALARRGKIGLCGILIDHPPSAPVRSPDLWAVAQMNYITGRAVPVMVGSPRVPAEGEWGTAAAARDLAGVRAFLDRMRQAPRPVTVHVIGSCRDIALALRLEPNLFSNRCAAIYLNAGSGTPDPKQARRLEWNASLEPAAYAALFRAPCPVYWLPCFEVVHPAPADLFRAAEYGSFYRFRQGEILPCLSPRVQNYFLYMFGAGGSGGANAASRDPPWLRHLTGPVDAEALAAQNRGERNMWCTAGFLHAAGLSVTGEGRPCPRIPPARRCCHQRFDGCQSRSVFPIGLSMVSWKPRRSYVTSSVMQVVTDKSEASSVRRARKSAEMAPASGVRWVHENTALDDVGKAFERGGSDGGEPSPRGFTVRWAACWAISLSILSIWSICRCPHSSSVTRTP